MEVDEHRISAAGNLASAVMRKYLAVLARGEDHPITTCANELGVERTFIRTLVKYTGKAMGE